MDKKKVLAACAGLSTVMLLSSHGTALAAYSSTGDSGVNVVDYIENRRRSERENRLSEAQKELQRDAAELRSEIRGPIDPTKQLPVAVEGDDMMYDERTGDVYAKGNVRITEIDARRFESDEATGNLKEQEIKVEGKGHMLQVPVSMGGKTGSKANQPADMDGYNIVYNYGTQVGSMDEAKGKLGRYYIYGKRIEFYPDRVLIYDGYATRCGAKTPDYRLTGSFIEIYPQKEMIIHDMSMKVKNATIYSEKEHHVDISPNANNNPTYPRVGYSNSDGVWISYRFQYDIASRFDAFADLAYYTKHGMRNVYGLEWKNAGSYASVQYGRYVDGDDNWIKKEPTFIYTYSNRIGRLPLSYGLSFEMGRWENKGIKSTHTRYGVSLAHDTIYLGSRKLRLNLGTGYSITRESYDHSRVDGFNYNGVLVDEMDDNFAIYAGYYYSKANKMNSLFAYDTNDYSRKGVAGVSLGITPRDRLVVGTEFDMAEHSLRDVDYYWFHDMHCVQMILRYRDKRDQWHVTFQFTPW
ncbi:MAG: LPS-assembly protein LptD [Schwartzia sp.]|nr:LPS-assembly protein LptD [Schwartzia sp. (in: firmicutes)]